VVVPWASRLRGTGSVLSAYGQGPGVVELQVVAGLLVRRASLGVGPADQLDGTGLPEVDIDRDGVVAPSGVPGQRVGVRIAFPLQRLDRHPGLSARPVRPEHGAGATAGLSLANGRFGVIAATSSQLQKAVIFPSRYPRVTTRISAAAPLWASWEPFSLARNGRPVATAFAVELQVSAGLRYPHR
jgi:hypothetical protein